MTASHSGFAQSSLPDSLLLRAAMERILKEEELVGVVWAAVLPGNNAIVGAAGLANSPLKTPLTVDNRVHVGSVAKTLLATGVLRLVTQQKVALDTPLSALLPGITFDNPWAAEHPLLLRHLLDQTSGLADVTFGQIFTLAPKPNSPLREMFRGDSSPLRVRTMPGSRFSYSNIGYALIGMVIESVTGQRYEEYLDAHLLLPLGMRNSTFHFVTQTGAHADAQLAMGHFEEGMTQIAVPSFIRPAGQFTTTAMDMVLFARFLMSDGTINGQPLVATELLRAMGVPPNTEARTAGLEIGYGLGLRRRDRHGAVGLCHDGSTVGFRAMFCLFPEEQKAFFVAMNADSETADVGRFDAALIKALAIVPPTATPIGTSTSNFAEWQGFYVLSPNRFDTFSYVDRVFNFARVRWDGTHLRLKPFQSAERILSPVGDMLFRAHDRSSTSHVLVRSANGNEIVTDGLQSYERIAPWRLILLWVSLAAGLLGLCYVLFVGLTRTVRRSLPVRESLFLPFVAVMLLLAPVPLFLNQSFLALGDVTAASVVLALVTGVLPIAMATGLVIQFRRRANGQTLWRDTFAMSAVLQWMLVLAVWGLVPFRLWA